jgi:hypothetical protein
VGGVEEDVWVRILRVFLPLDMVRLALLITLLPAIAYSQAPFELENRKALKLTEARLQMIHNKEWHVEKVETDNRGDLTENKWTGRRLNYKPEGTFIYGGYTGTGQLFKENTSHINLKVEVGR